MSQENEELVASIVALMGTTSDERRMWRDHYAALFDQAAEMDDLALLRGAKIADEFEKDFMAFASSFPGVQVVAPPDGGFYAATLGIAKMDREVRKAFLRAYAAVLRDT